MNKFLLGLSIMMTMPCIIANDKDSSTVAEMLAIIEGVRREKGLTEEHTCWAKKTYENNQALSGCSEANKNIIGLIGRKVISNDTSIGREDRLVVADSLKAMNQAGFHLVQLYKECLSDDKNPVDKCDKQLMALILMMNEQMLKDNANELEMVPNMVALLMPIE